MWFPLLTIIQLIGDSVLQQKHGNQRLSRP